MEKKIGVLLVNLGSPSSLKVSAVRSFLKQFLWDKRVVNLPRPLWWLILHGVVLPFRPRKSAEAYRKIWHKDGSPLIVFTKSLAEKVHRTLADSNIIVDYAMSYGEPSIPSKLAGFKAQQVDEIIILPLYPQYSSTTTASVYDASAQVLSSWRHIHSSRFISDYHQHSHYINAIAKSIETAWYEQGKGELLLMSFHGLPDKLTEWGDPYFHQCQKTAQLIAAKLNLQPSEWKLVFQSRFGRAKWLQPYCVETLQELPKQGIKAIDVVCPGFAVDCLETLEEIAMTNKEIFMAAGGESYRYIPALNDAADQVAMIIELIKT
jgi:ferrochelatase